MKQNKLKAVIFDLDGVITDTAEYHFLAWKKLAEEFGVVFTHEFNEQLKGVSRMDSLEKILTLQDKQFTEEKKIAFATKKNDYYCKLIENITPADILPNIVELMKEIKQQGLKIGLASVSKNAFTVMKSLQLESAFDYMVDANKIERSKPNPEVFLRAAEMLGVLPGECIGVEDAAAGVEAIKRAGMFAVGVGSKDILHQADIVYVRTEDICFREVVEKFSKE